MKLTLRTPALIAAAGLLALNCGGEQKTPETQESAATLSPLDPAPRINTAAARTPSPNAEASDATAASSQPEQADAPATPKADPLSDEQIAAITDAVNSAEIAQAKVAQTKSKDTGVKRFAAMMISHHGDAKRKQAKLKLKMEDSGTATAMKANAENTLSTLKASAAKDFDRAYVAAQIDGHQQVLDAINQQLLPNAKSPELKAYLEEIKPTVEQHLKEATELQQAVDAKTSLTDSAGKASR